MAGYLRESSNSSLSSRIISGSRPSLKPVRDAGREVALEQGRLERLQGALDGVGLLEDVDAVHVLLDHLADALEVALDGRQSIEDVLLVGLHVRLHPTPWGEGRPRLWRFAPVPVC